LFRRFSELQESLVRELSQTSFIKAVKKIFHIKQAKYLRFAIKYFPKPYVGKNMNYGLSLERVTRFISHLKEIGIKKLIDGRCIYVVFLDGRYIVKTSNADIAYLNHDKTFQVTVDLVQQLTVLLEEKIEVIDYFRSIGLPGGGKIAHVKRFIAHEGVRRGTNSDYHIPVNRSLGFYSEDQSCYNRHLADYGGAKPYYCLLKVYAESISENNGNVSLSVFHPYYGYEELLDCSQFDKTRFHHSYKINLRKYTLDEICSIEIHLHFDSFFGASTVVPYYDIFFYDMYKGYGPEDDYKFKSFNCDCLKTKDFFSFSANARMLSCYYDVMAEKGFYFCRPIMAILPVHWSVLYESQNLSSLGFVEVGQCSECENSLKIARLRCGHTICNFCFKKKYHNNPLVVECSCHFPIIVNHSQPARLDIDEYYNDDYGHVLCILSRNEEDYRAKFRGSSLAWYRGNRALFLVVDGEELIYSL